MWDPGLLALNYLDVGERFLHVKVHHVLEDFSTMLSAVHVSNNEAGKAVLWNQMRNL